MGNKIRKIREMVDELYISCYKCIETTELFLNINKALDELYGYNFIAAYDLDYDNIEQVEHLMKGEWLWVLRKVRKRIVLRKFIFILFYIKKWLN